jgi:hypothetical protein
MGAFLALRAKNRAFRPSFPCAEEGSGLKPKRLSWYSMDISIPSALRRGWLILYTEAVPKPTGLGNSLLGQQGMALLAEKKEWGWRRRPEPRHGRGEDFGDRGSSVEKDLFLGEIGLIFTVHGAPPS